MCRFNRNIDKHIHLSENKNNNPHKKNLVHIIYYFCKRMCGIHDVRTFRRGGYTEIFGRNTL
ncbi:hypothetical protein I230019B6_13670 [Firmicutes bacterium i23-0019-B6]